MLSPRQLEVLSMIASGFGKKEIAYHCRISEHTVAKHARRAYAKLDACTEAQAVNNAWLAGIHLSLYIRTVTKLDHSTNS